jgi:hypothetical protein
VLFSRLHSFPYSGVSSLLFTLFGFADEDTPVLFICLQLFHTPSWNSCIDRRDESPLPSFFSMGEYFCSLKRV